MSNIGIGVNFTGTENVNRTISSIKSGLNGLEREAKDVGDTSSGAFSKAKSGMEDLGRAVQNTGGSFTVLKGATSVFLGELATKITGLAIKAVKMLAKEIVELGKEMIKLGLESNASAKGMFDNFNSEITKLKTLFGVELVSVIGPALQGVADNISRLTAQGSFEPLVASFGSLASKVLELLGSTWDLVKAMMNVSDDEEAIAKIADAFDRVGYFVSALNELLERTQALISSLNLDKVGQIYNFLSAGTPGGALWGYAGQQVSANRGAERNGWGAPSKDNAKEVEKNAKATKTQTGYTEEQIKAMKDNIKTIAQATLADIGYTYTTKETQKNVGNLGNTAASAVDYINGALRSGGGSGGSGGGGSGCRTFQTGTTVEGGGTANGPVGGGGASGSPGMLWYNVLGNENAAAVSAKGESWASTVSNVTRNSCSGQVCSFKANGHTFYGDGSGSFTSVNDALITNKGEVIQFHPDDNILAFKGNGPRGSTNVTINVNGAGDPERVAELILKKINTKVGMAW